jgi:hypothetical protein
MSKIDTRTQGRNALFDMCLNRQQSRLYVAIVQMEVLSSDQTSDASGLLYQAILAKDPDRGNVILAKSVLRQA